MFVFLHISAGNNVFFSRNKICGGHSQALFSVRFTAENEKSDISCFLENNPIRVQ